MKEKANLFLRQSTKTLDRDMQRSEVSNNLEGTNVTIESRRVGQLLQVEKSIVRAENLSPLPIILR